MINNYFFLNRLVVELNKKISNSKLLEVFSQEKNQAILKFIDEENIEFYLLISVNKNEPYLRIRKTFYRAKKNTAEFFKDYLPDKLTGITIAENDRIIKFSFTNYEVYFGLMGNNTNLFLRDSDNNFEFFKKMKSQDILNITNFLETKKFISHYNKSILNDISYLEEFGSISKQFPMIRREIIRELDPDNFDSSSVIKLINMIFYDKICVGVDPTRNLIEFIPKGFKLCNILLNPVDFDDYITAIDEYFNLKYRYDEFNKILNKIKKHLNDELGRISEKINNLRIRIENGNNSEKYNIAGSLILANVSSIVDGLKEIAVEDYNGKQIFIKLDEKLSVIENANKYFDKSKNEKISYRTSLELLSKTEDKFQFYKKLQDEIISITNINTLKEIAKKMNLDKENNKEITDQFKFRHYIVENKYHIFVGKDSVNNDLLTTKFAKQNDLWFHARSVSGSHVVLRIDNSKEIIPKNIIKKAASIAAFYSKAKSSKLVPVAYTFKKYVIKRKGMEPGKVQLTREEVVMVEPKIPEDCEYKNE